MKQVSSKPWEVLQAVSTRKLSGCLTISYIHNPDLGWRLFFGSGLLTYATAMKGQLERIESLWQYLPDKFPIPSLVKAQNFNSQSPAKSDYELLLDWKEKHQVSITTFRRLLIYLTKEAVSQVLSNDLMNMQFEANASIKPVLVAANVRDLVKPSLVDIRKWQSLRSIFPSPFA